MAQNEKVNIIIAAKNKAKSVLSSVQGQIVGIGTAYLAFSAVKNLLSSIVEVGIEHEKVWNDVSASLQRHGHEVEKNTDLIAQFSDEIQTLSGVSDEVVGKSVQQFIDYGSSVKQAMDTTRVAVDLAAGSGISLKAATDLLAKASVGYTGTLSRYGIIIDENIPKSEKFAAAVQQINEKFAGAATARAETAAVKMALAAEKLGDLGEAIFELFSPTLIFGLNLAIDTLTGITLAIQPIVTAIGSFTTKIDTHKESIKEVTIKYNSMETELADITQRYKEGAIGLKEFHDQIALIGKFKIAPAFTKEDLKNIQDAALEVGIVADQMANMGDMIPSWQLKEFNKELEETKRKKAFEQQKFAAETMAEGVVRSMAFIAQMDSETTDIQIANMKKSMTEWQEKNGIKVEAVARGYSEDMTGAEEVRAYKTELMELGLLEEEAFTLARNQILYDYQVEQDERMNELALNRAAAELNITREQLQTITNEYKKELDKVQNYISQYTSRISSDFRSSIHRMVADTDKGLLDMKKFWESMGKTIRSIIVDMILDAIISMVAGIFKSITAHVAEGIAVKRLTAQYISLAAAKSAVNPFSSGGRIAAAATVKASLSGLLGFDDPINDAIAERHGEDYANRFMKGQNKVFGSPNFGNEMVAMSPEQGFSGSTINITINGDNYNTESLIEKIENSIRNGASSIALNDEDTITGSANARFA